MTCLARISCLAPDSQAVRPDSCPPPSGHRAAGWYNSGFLGGEARKMETKLLKTPLYDWHVSHGGRMVEFAG